MRSDEQGHDRTTGGARALLAAVRRPDWWSVRPVRVRGVRGDGGGDDHAGGRSRAARAPSVPAGVRRAPGQRRRRDGRSRWVERPEWPGRPAGSITRPLLRRAGRLRARPFHAGPDRGSRRPGSGWRGRDRVPVRPGGPDVPAVLKTGGLLELLSGVDPPHLVRAGPRRLRRAGRGLALGVPRCRGAGGGRGCRHHSAPARVATPHGRSAVPQVAARLRGRRRGRGARPPAARVATRRPGGAHHRRSGRPAPRDTAPGAFRHLACSARAAGGDRDPRHAERVVLLR